MSKVTKATEWRCVTTNAMPHVACPYCGGARTVQMWSLLDAISGNTTMIQMGLACRCPHGTVRSEVMGPREGATVKPTPATTLYHCPECHDNGHVAAHGEEVATLESDHREGCNGIILYGDNADVSLQEIRDRVLPGPNGACPKVVARNVTCDDCKILDCERRGEE